MSARATVRVPVRALHEEEQEEEKYRRVGGREGDYPSNEPSSTRATTATRWRDSTVGGSAGPPRVTATTGTNELFKMKTYPTSISTSRTNLRVSLFAHYPHSHSTKQPLPCLTLPQSIPLRLLTEQTNTQPLNYSRLIPPTKQATIRTTNDWLVGLKIRRREFGVRRTPKRILYPSRQPSERSPHTKARTTRP